MTEDEPRGVAAFLRSLASTRRGARAAGGGTDELARALEELSEARKFLERLVTAGPLIVKRMRLPDFKVTYVSPNMERLFGMTGEEVMAPGALRRIVHPEDADAFWDAHERVADGSSDQEVMEHRRRMGHTAAYRWASVVIVPEVNEAGTRVAVLDYLSDVDDRRRAEQSRQEAQEAAEAANRSKSEFLSRMSHELRTPLNAVLGFGQLLELEELSHEQRDAVTHILRGGRHLLELIDEILDISRIEAGRLAMSPEPVLASEIVRETMELIRPLAHQQDVELLGTLPDGCDCYVLVDRQRFKQVLLNLLSNAIKYNRPRGTVAVSCESPSRSWSRISVTDTGIGIAPHLRDLVFVPFERLGAEKGGVDGTGIGLALSQRLIEAMGGSIGVESAVGRGSTFWIDVPRAEDPLHRLDVAPVAPAETPTGVTARKQVILQIEDNLSNLTLIERVLSQRPGIEVVAAMQGSLGLDLAEQQRPDLILLDLHLPDIGGEEVLQRLRAGQATESIPVVIVSADATGSQVDRLLAAGATAYLTKPIDVRRLLEVVDGALAKGTDL